MSIIFAVSALVVSGGFVPIAAFPAVTFSSTSFAKVVVCRLISHCRLLLLLQVFVECLSDFALLVEQLDLAQLELVKFLLQVDVLELGPVNIVFKFVAHTVELAHICVVPINQT